MWSIRCILSLAVTGYCLGRGSENSATVEFPDLPTAVSSKCDLPRHLHVEIKTEDETISLNLTRSVSGSLPVYVMRQGKFVAETPFTGKDNVLYQSDAKDAEFEVTCHRNGQLSSTLVLDGTLSKPDGLLYSLTKSKLPDLYTLKEERLDPSRLGSAIDNDDRDTPTNARVIRSAGERIKRAIPNDVFVDIVAIVENTVYQRWFSRSAGSTDTLAAVSRHFTHIFNAVDLRFKTASPRLNIKLVGLVIEESASEWFESVRSLESDQSKIDANTLLDASLNYSKTPEFPLPEFDHLVTFTSVNLYWINNGVPDDSLAGLAYVGQICKNKGFSGSVVEYGDVFISDVRVTSHEVGHCLSARHDGTNGNTCDSAQNFIMSGSPKVYTDSNPFTFSSCSADYFDTHVNDLLTSTSTYPKTCLLQSLQVISIPDIANELPGQIYTLEQQCQMAEGLESGYCAGIDISDSNVCLKMYCALPGSTSCSRRYAARGTTCADKMWCEGGQCVPITCAPCQYLDILNPDTCQCTEHPWCTIVKDKQLCATYYGPLCGCAA